MKFITKILCPAFISTTSDLEFARWYYSKLTSVFMSIRMLFHTNNAKYWYAMVQSILIFVFSGVGGFFVKHVKTGMCINDTSKIQFRGSWGSLSFVELTNNCLDPAAQFRFRDNGAMLNLKRQGCLAVLYKDGSGYRLDMFYIYVADNLEREACAQDSNNKRAINQTLWGGLMLQYKRFRKDSFQTMCAVTKTHDALATNQGIDPYIGLITNCNDAEDKRFKFGKSLSFFMFKCTSSEKLPRFKLFNYLNTEC